MIRHILVPTDGSEESFIGVRYGVGLAKQWEATLHGLYVVDVKMLEGPFFRDVSAALGTAPYVNYQGNIAMILEERGKAALEHFRKTCEDAGVKHNARLLTGVVPRVIVEQGELADLIVLGRSGEHSEWLDGLVGSTTEAVVRRADRPVVVTGKDTPGHDLFVVAYDGSHYAKEALQRAADLGADWKAALRVLVVATESRAATLVREARQYLEAHQLQVDYVIREGDPSEAIVADAAESHADLLVMGAYGHTKVRELVVGSTTAYAINHAPCPVLLTR